MKILHIITRMNQGGTARWIETLSYGLMKAGWESTLVAGEVGKNEIEDDAFKELHGVKVHFLGKGKGPVNDFRAFAQLRKIIKIENPDVVNTHTSKAGVIGRMAAISTLKSKPMIIHTFHGHLLYGYFSKPLTKIFTFLEKCMSKLTDHFIVSGESVRDELMLSGIARIEEYSSIKPGVSARPKLDSKEVRDIFGILDSSIVIGWMGRFESIKSPKRVIELSEKFPSVIFLMAGDGSQFNELKAMAPSNLLLPGWCRADEVWSASDIALLTSENEAIPIALIEAGLAGLPSVAENVGSVSEVVKNGETGFLCNSRADRVKALEILIVDAQLRKNMGENAHKYCSKEFNIELFTQRHINTYLKVLQK